MQIRVVRSFRRRRTVHGRLVNGVLEVLAPASMDQQRLDQLIQDLVRRAKARLAARRLDHHALAKRAAVLNNRYFGGRLRWTSIDWVTNQDTRFGSCTPSTGRIRISHRLASMPRFVLDYVLIHELAHLEHTYHSRSFWQAVNRYRLAERARGYLMAIADRAIALAEVRDGQQIVSM